MVTELRGAIALLPLLLPVASGCARSGPPGPPGLLFTYSTRPLTTNFHTTPVVKDPVGKDGVGAGNVFQLQYYVRILWGDDSIGGPAKEAGFDEVYYADITTFSIYTYFLWERVHVYGHRAGTPPIALYEHPAPQ